MKQLEQFYANESMREAVKSYLLGYLNQQALEIVYRKEETKHIAEAKVAIEGAFAQMSEQFAKVEANTPVNEAR